MQTQPPQLNSNKWTVIVGLVVGFCVATLTWIMYLPVHDKVISHQYIKRYDSLSDVIINAEKKTVAATRRADSAMTHLTLHLSRADSASRVHQRQAAQWRTAFNTLRQKLTLNPKQLDSLLIAEYEEYLRTHPDDTLFTRPR